MDGKPILQQFSDDIFAVVAKFSDQGLSVAEALGALDIVHATIIRDGIERGEQDDPEFPEHME